VIVDTLLARLPDDEATKERESGAPRIAAVKGDVSLLARLGDRIPLESDLYALALGNVAGAAGLREEPSLGIARLLLERGVPIHRRSAQQLVELATNAGDSALADLARRHADRS